MDRQVTPPRRVTSPSWCPLSPCKQAQVSGLRNVGKEENISLSGRKRKQKLMSTTTTTKSEKDYNN